MADNTLMIEPIGFVESCYKQRMAAPRQSLLVPAATAVLHFEKKVQPELSLQGLEGFSHLWLIFGFHENSHIKYSAKVCPPRLDGESRGVFATRSPHRWNSLGLSLVKIEKVGFSTVEVSGVDLIEKTPVYDIKPYLPETEAIPQASAGWTENLVHRKMKVEWPDEVLRWLPQKDYELISESLALDPRPNMYKQQEKIFRLRIGQYDVSFVCLENKRIVVRGLSA